MVGSTASMVAAVVPRPVIRLPIRYNSTSQWVLQNGSTAWRPESSAASPKPQRSGVHSKIKTPSCIYPLLLRTE